MSYYGVGDYYMAGDPGLFSSIGGLFKRAGRGALGFATGGVGGAIAGLTAPTRRSAPRMGSFTVTPRAIAPGGRPFVTRGGVGTGRRRRKMNYANGKALTRANRRVDGFVKLARKSLKHTNYKIVSKSAGRSKRPISISERGAGSVHVG